MKKIDIPIRMLPVEMQLELQGKINIILDKLHRPRIHVFDTPEEALKEAIKIQEEEK